MTTRPRVEGPRFRHRSSDRMLRKFLNDTLNVVIYNINNHYHKITKTLQLQGFVISSLHPK